MYDNEILNYQDPSGYNQNYPLLIHIRPFSSLGVVRDVVKWDQFALQQSLVECEVLGPEKGRTNRIALSHNQL